MNDHAAFAGRLALVTGAASGIGLAIARALAEAGLKVVMTDADGAALDTAAATVPGAIAMPLDVRDRDRWTAVLDAAEAACGPLAVLVSNAGVAGSRLPVAATSFEAWEWTRSINLDGSFNALSLAVPRILASGRPGHVFATASLGALIVVPDNGAYSATKAAVVAFCEALRQEVAPAGVNVSVLCPGLVHTALVEANDARAPADVAVGDHEPELIAQMREAMDPARVGDLIVEALGSDRFWLFTHPDLGDRVRQRSAEIDRALG